LHYREAVRRDKRLMADHLVAVNAGMAGGKHARELLDTLTSNDT
jgi:hypothetical protein